MPFVLRLPIKIMLCSQLMRLFYGTALIVSDLPFANCSLSSSMSDFSVHDNVHSPSPASLHQPLLCTCFNARSIVNKQLDLHAMIATTTPDVIVITETFLDSCIMDSEILPREYSVFIRDGNHHNINCCVE